MLESKPRVEAVMQWSGAKLHTAEPKAIVLSTQ